jgi:hypothetical protein
MNGIEIIAAERQRQIEQEGWSAEHDDEHREGELGKAAACYAQPPEIGVRCQDWPWDRKWWKPTPSDRIRELAKAGALIAAEIDRLKRPELQKPRCQHKIRRVENEKGQYERRCQKCGIEAHSDGDFSYMCGSEYCRCMS